MKIIRQPKNSSFCGQACVAMIADISLDGSIKLFGTKGVTTTKQVALVLQNLGFKCENRLKRITKFFKLPIEKIFLFRLIWKNKKGSHWVIWNGDEQRWYDPANKHYLHKDYWKNSKYMYPTSYLKINEKELEKVI